MGALRRVSSMTTVLELAGADVVDLRLRVDHRASAADLIRAPVGRLLRSEIVPEALSWSPRSVRRALDALRPDVVICETSRAFDPTFESGPWTLVLDYVDRLSVSYRDRSTIVGSAPRRLLFRSLSATAARFERHALPTDVRAIAAGWEDAEALDAAWFPIQFEPASSTPRPTPTHDLLFFGNLSYPPNVEAVERIDRFWSALVRRRPGTTLLLAGSSPTPGIRTAVERHGWTLEADFEDLGAVLGSCRLGVVPLVHASGIQTKVLEAAAFGLAQVVDPITLAGMAPGFPAAVASGDDAMIEHIADLLADDEQRESLGRDARAHIAERYAPEVWVPWATALLDGRP